MVPAYNEERRLPATLDRIVAYFHGIGCSFEVIVVDDGSCDGTRAVAAAAATRHPEIRLLGYAQNRGKGAAVKTGMLAAEGLWLLFSDADLSTPIEDLVLLRSAASAGAHVVIGSRAVATPVRTVEEPWQRWLMGRTFNLLVRNLALPGFSDTQCGFKLFSRPAALQIFPRVCLDGFGFDVEALYLARYLGFDVAEVPVRWQYVPGSKVHPWRDSARMCGDLVRIRLNSARGMYTREGGQLLEHT